MVAITDPGGVAYGARIDEIPRPQAPLPGCNIMAIRKPVAARLPRLPANLPYASGVPRTDKSVCAT
jgi:hypothetical protein